MVNVLGDLLEANGTFSPGSFCNSMANTFPNASFRLSQTQSFTTFNGTNLFVRGIDQLFISTIGAFRIRRAIPISIGSINELNDPIDLLVNERKRYQKVHERI